MSNDKDLGGRKKGPNHLLSFSVNGGGHVPSLLCFPYISHKQNSAKGEK